MSATQEQILCLTCKWFNPENKNFPCQHPQFGGVISLLFEGIDHTKCVYYEPKEEAVRDV